MKDTTQSILRAVLQFAAGYAIAKGIVDQNTAAELSAALISLLTVAWGVKHHRAKGVRPGCNGGRRVTGACVGLLAIIALFGSGCVKSSLALVVREAKQDPARWKIQQNGWGNSITIERDGSAITNMPANRVTAIP